MMTQAGGYIGPGRPLTARNALASHRLTRFWRAAIAVASITAVPAANRPRGPACTLARERFQFLAGDCGGADMVGLGDDALAAVSLPFR